MPEIRRSLTLDRDSDTRVHVIALMPGEFTIWMDTDEDPTEGLCIGTGTTMQEAIADAIAELTARIQDLHLATREAPRVDHRVVVPIWKR